MLRILYVTLLVLIASSCTSPSVPSANVLRICFPFYPTTFDPRKSGDFVSATVICLLYEGLTRCLPDGTPELAIAETIDISEDKKTYTFHLKKTVWSDGTPITAYDFEQSWKQSIDPAAPSLCAYLFYPILNAEAASRGTKKMEEVGIHSLDAQTLEVILERPTPYFLSLTSFPSYFPVPQHKLTEIDASEFSARVISNGPFMTEKMESKNALVLRKNPLFWNPSAIRLEGISILILPSEQTALEMFEKGELDWLGGLLSPIPPDAVPSIQQRLQFFPVAASTFCTLNIEKAPFSNIHIRKAFSLAIDREEIAREILPTHQILATRYIPPSMDEDRNRNLFPPFDPKLAKEYFAQGLQELGISLDSISLHFPTGIVDRRLAQVLQQKWEEILGIRVQLEQRDFKTHKNILHNREYEIALAHWIAQYQDPINILERFKSRLNAKNYPAWEDRDFSHWLDLAQNAIHLNDRKELIDLAEERLAECCPLIPLYHWSAPSLTHPRVQNLQTTPSGGILFERCWISANF